MNALKLWWTENWKMVLALTAGVVSYMLVHLLGTLLLLVFFGIPMQAFFQLFVLVLAMGFVDRRAVSLSQWTRKSLWKNNDECCESEMVNKSQEKDE